MLEEISIKDFALIKELQLKLGPGLNLITGETGAGKSIILGALNMVLGSKATTNLIRSGAERAIVAANFNLTNTARFEILSRMLDEYGIDHEDGFLNLRREIKTDGKGRNFINSQQVPAAVLKSVGSHLVEIHGQNEHQGILKLQNHLAILDRYARLGSEVKKLKRLHKRNAELKQKLKSVSLDEKEKNRRLEILSHEIKEIQAAKLKDDKEFEELIAKEKTLRNAELILKGVCEAYQTFSQNETSLIGELSKVKNTVEDVSEYDPNLSGLSSQLQELFYQMEDVSAQLRDYQDKVYLNPQELEVLRERIDVIQNLQNKYGTSVKDILDRLEENQREHEGIEISSEEEEKVRKNIQANQEEMIELSKIVSQRRREASRELESKVCRELSELGMGETLLKLAIRWDHGEDGLYIHPEQQDKKYIIHSTGLDVVEFLIAANKNNALRPLRKIASGGEMSRIMLAFKKTIVDSDPISSMVFDEVDAGVGGKTAEAVGKKLRQLSENAQVIVITHLHQIAGISGSDTVHFRVGKSSQEGTRIERLNASQRVEEVARMISGKEINESAKEHARVLLQG